MSFQAYLDNIKAKTGKTAEDFKKLAERKGLLKPTVKAGDIVSWLKEDFDLGHGHAMAIYALLKSSKQPALSNEENLDKHFNGAKSSWRGAFDSLLSKLKEFGNDIRISPTSSYVSILKDKKKFAVVQVANDHMDIGIKLKYVEPTDGFEPAGSWNNMVTHRVRIDNPKQIDKELIAWLHKAYEQNSNNKKSKK